MNDVRIYTDRSYFKMLDTEFNELTTTLADTESKETVLIVNTGDVYEYYQPTGRWYLQA